MHRISRKMVLALVVVGALVAGGAAYTAQIDTTNASTLVAGQGAITVHNATLNSATYGFSADGQTINSVTMTFAGDLTGDTVDVGFDGTTAACSGADTTSGVVNTGVYDSGTSTTTVTCSSLGEATESASSTLDVVVHS